MQLILCIFSSKYLKFDSRFLFSPLQFDWFHQFFFLRENILIHPAHHFSVRFSSKCIDGPKKKTFGPTTDSRARRAHEQNAMIRHLLSGPLVYLKKKNLDRWLGPFPCAKLNLSSPSGRSRVTPSSSCARRGLWLLGPL